MTESMVVGTKRTENGSLPATRSSERGRIVEFNIADLFECVADTVPDREAAVSSTGRVSYRDLDERATRLAHVFAESGIGAGDTEKRDEAS